MRPIDIKELVAVTVVGIGLAWVAKKVPVVRNPLVIGAGLYTLGYYVRGQRPPAGWMLPGRSLPQLTSAPEV